MKTGFICESGFNVVASATRHGRKLVAVVLGEPSVASRNDRTTDLLESGFKRYSGNRCSARASIGSRSKPR
jgi:D-alanyl-D-alanine carboxypeptidase